MTNTSPQFVPGDYTMVGYGLDAALRHGVLIRAEFHCSPARGFNRLARTNTIFRWTDKMPISVGNESSYEDIQALNNRTIRDIEPGIPMAIDFDYKIGLWAKNNLPQTVRMTYLVADIRRAAQNKGCPVVFLSPAQVRGAFGLRANVPKADVWEAFGIRVDIPTPFRQFFTDKLDDHGDSIVLAYLAAKAARAAREEEHNVRNAQHAITSGLPRN